MIDMTLRWNIDKTQDEGAFFDDYVMDIIAHASPPLPAHDFKLGTTEVHWHEVAPFVAHVAANGKSTRDELFAVHTLSIELANLGYRRAHVQMTYDHSESFEKTATWDDVYKKAARLVRSGNVTLNSNGADHISATVQGDHGTYPVEIYRDDPNSPAVTRTHCECLLPGGKVFLADGSVKDIEDIVEGDRVLTATGRIGIVSHLHINEYDGEAVWLQPSGSTEGVWVTANHPLFDHTNKLRDAGTFSEGDLVYYPQAQDERDFDIDSFEFLDDSYRYDTSTKRVRKVNKLWATRPELVSGEFNSKASSLPAIIPFDEKFARLAGLYMAEGNIVSNHTHEVRWTFDYEGRENHLVQEIQDILDFYGLRTWVEQKAHGTVVCCASWPLVQVFAKLFGTGSRTKRIDERVMQLPKSILESFLDAWVDGDGHRNNMKIRDGIATASLTLVAQLRYLLARIERESVIRHYESNASELVPGGRDIYTITWRNTGGKGQGRHYFEDKRVVQTLREPKRKHYRGTVYNLEVLDEHTYVVYPGIANHNCDWGNFQNMPRTRQWKQYQDRPCAHILAAYWKALATPMDSGGVGEGQYADPFGQQQTQPGGQMQLPGMGPETPPSGPQPTPDIPVEQFPQSQQTLMNGPAVPWEQIQRGNQLQTLLRRQREIKQQQQQAAPPPPPTPQEALPQFPMDPALQPQHNLISTPGGKAQTPLNPVQYPQGLGGTFSSWRPGIIRNVFSNQVYNNGDIVELQQPDWGTQVGRSEEHGAGQPFEIPAGQLGEVLGTHPSTGMVNVLYMGDPWDKNKEFEPYGATCWHFPSYLKIRNDIKKPGPAIRRYQ